jgi:TPR repeat protein
MKSKLEHLEGLVKNECFQAAYEYVSAEGLDRVTTQDVALRVYFCLYKIMGHAQSPYYNPSKAVTALKKNIKRSCTKSISELGRCKLFGLGVDKDVAEAEDLFRRSANEIQSSFYIAEIHSKGMIDIKGEAFYDYEEAKPHYLAVYKSNSDEKFASGLSYVSIVSSEDSPSKEDRIEMFLILSDLVDQGYEAAYLFMAKQTFSDFIDATKRLAENSRTGKFKNNLIMDKMLKDIQVSHRKWLAFLNT